MSSIKYTQEAADAIRNAGKEAAKLSVAGSPSTTAADRMAYQLGAVQYVFEALARKAECDSSLSGVINRLAESMTFDLFQASELIDAISAGIKRQHADATEVCDVLKDAAQVAYEAFEVGQEREPVDLLEAIGLDRPNVDALAIRRAA